MNWMPQDVPDYDPSVGQGYPGLEQGYRPNLRLRNPEQIDPATLQGLGYWKCPTRRMANGKPCPFWLSPQAKAVIENHNGYFTCPACRHSYDLLEELGSPQLQNAEAFSQEFSAGGGTRVGIPLADQGQIGENIVAQLGELPGYGPITWWHPGGANANSPLDGTVRDWGIEVKTINYDATHHRFVPSDGAGPDVIRRKNEAAAELGLKGILGILVLLDYRRDLADIYVKEMPLEPWRGGTKMFQGIAAFRKNTAQRLVAEIPFDNPLKDPHNPTPHQYIAAEDYQRPKAVMPGHLQTPEPEEAPF